MTAESLFKEEQSLFKTFAACFHRNKSLEVAIVNLCGREVRK